MTQPNDLSKCLANTTASCVLSSRFLVLKDDIFLVYLSSFFGDFFSCNGRTSGHLCSCFREIRVLLVFIFCGFCVDVS